MTHNTTVTPENNAVAIIEFEPIVKQSGLEKAEQYAAIFSPFMVTLKQLSDKAGTVNHENPTQIDAKIARELRLALVKNRTATEKKKDESKQALLAESNLIQNLNNVVVNTSKLIEADLDAVEKFAENKEKQRKAELAIERAAMFEQYGTDLTGYDLGGMADNVFSDLLESQKLLHEKRIADAARIEAERIEAERLELERQAALKAENERLKAEQEAAKIEADRIAAELEAERKAAAEKLEAERAEAVRLAKIEQDKADALAKETAEKLAAIEAENNRVREKAAAELKASQEAAEKAQAELQAKKEAERKAELDRIEQAKQAEATRIAAEKKAAKAPDKEKLTNWVNSMTVTGIGTEKLKPESIEVANQIFEKFTAFKTWALQQIETI